MNPTNGEKLPDLEVPKIEEGLEKQQEKSMESRPAQESAVAKQSPVTDKSLPVDPATVSSAQPQVLPAPKKGDDDEVVSSRELTASENDRIERQWIDKAKEIVGQTKEDPYVQKKEMSKVKADYIKKRYNKTIPTDDTVLA